MRNPELYIPYETLDAEDNEAELLAPSSGSAQDSAALNGAALDGADLDGAALNGVAMNGAASLDEEAESDPERAAVRRRFESAAATLSLTENLVESSSASPAEKKPLGLVSHAAMAMAPLYGALYDLQMQLGGGVRVVRQRVQLPTFPRTASPLKIAFLSDLHYGPTSGRVAARQAWQIARDANPDVLLLGGDYLYADERGLPSLLRELQRWKNAPPPGGMYACLGNHDHIGNLETIITGLQACGVRVLLNEAAPLPEPWRDVWIVGSDDTREGDPQPELALASVPQGACSIMLAHSPDICEFAALKRCGLTLCGHTHGGQICLPNGDAPYMPSKWGKHYAWGLHRHAGNWVFVSRGVGTVGLPLRLWSPPDVAVLEVTSTVRTGAIV